MTSLDPTLPTELVSGYGAMAGRLWTVHQAGMWFVTVTNIKQAVTFWPHPLDTDFLYAGIQACCHGGRKASM
jgi:hypothetical protein